MLSIPLHAEWKVDSNIVSRAARGETVNIK
jgi:hypothetical protein